MRVRRAHNGTPCHPCSGVDEVLVQKERATIADACMCSPSVDEMVANNVVVDGRRQSLRVAVKRVKGDVDADAVRSFFKARVQ